MQAEAFTWHYVVALGLFLALGAIGHVCHAIFNPLPDRLSDSATMDMIISDGYSWSDRLFGSEYDDGGYYRLHSLRNLRNATLLSGFSGMVVMLLSPGAAGVLAHVIDTGLSGLGVLCLQRVENAALL